MNFIVLVLVSLSLLVPVPQQPPIILAYFAGEKSDVGKLDLRGVTHLVYCFAKLKGSQIALESDAQADVLRMLVAKKKQYPSLKVMIALGGWGGCETCSEVFGDVRTRSEFVSSVRRLLQQTEADGIDIDWESPVIGGFKDHPASDKDIVSFTALIRSLRDTLGPQAVISFDANTDPEFISRSVSWDSVMPLVDFVNLMTYGLPNDKPGHTGHHTALFSSPVQTESVDKGVRTLIRRGVPREKMLIGAAFYGFKVGKVDSVNHGLGRPGTLIKTITYDEIKRTCTSERGYVRFWDSVAHAPTLYNRADSIFVTYDDHASVAFKCRYVIDMGLGGIMFWKVNGDLPQNELLNTIRRVLVTMH